MKKIFLVVIVVGVLFCCFTGCSKTTVEPEIERFSVTYVEFSNKLEDSVWDDGEVSSVFKVKTADGIMTIPERSTLVVYIDEGEEIYLEVKTTISNVGVEKEYIKYTLYVPDSFIEGYNYQPM